MVLGDGGQAALDGGHGSGACGGELGQVQRQRLGFGRQALGTPRVAPVEKIGPVGAVGAQRAGGASVAHEGARLGAEVVRRDAQRSIGGHTLLHQIDNLALAFGEQRFDGLHLRTARSLVNPRGL